MTDQQKARLAAIVMELSYCSSKRSAELYKEVEEMRKEVQE